MVIIDKRVEKATSLTDNSVSVSYLTEKTVVAAATGALAAIIIETSSVPRIPISSKTNKDTSGITISLKIDTI